MTLKLDAHIRQLIAAHDYVVIPGFGGFVGKYAAAHFHPGTHEFHPPNKSLAFNRNLIDDDGLLVQQIVNATALEADSARDAIKIFAQKLNRKLENNEAVTLAGIGRIFQDIEGRVRFRQDDESILLPASYGLPHFKAKPILRQKLVDTGPAIKTEEDAEKRVRQFPTWIWAAAAAVILIIILFGSYFALPGLQQRANSLMGWNGQSAAHEVKMEGKMAFAGPIDWNLDEFEMRAYPRLPEEVRKPYDVVVNNNIPSGYFIVVSSFQNRNRARALMEELKQEGRDAYLFPTADNGFNRVGLFVSTANPYEASQALSDLRANYRPDAWVVKNKGQ